MDKSNVHFHFKSLLQGKHINVIISSPINTSLISCHSAYMSKFTSVQAIILNRVPALGHMDHYYIWKAFCHMQANIHRSYINVQLPKSLQVKAVNELRNQVGILLNLLIKICNLLSVTFKIDTVGCLATRPRLQQIQQITTRTFLVLYARCWAQLLSHADSLRSHRLEPTRVLCPWKFSRQEYWRGLSCLSSRGSSQPTDQTQVSRIAGRFFTS